VTALGPAPLLEQGFAAHRRLVPGLVRHPVAVATRAGLPLATHQVDLDQVPDGTADGRRADLEALGQLGGGEEPGVLHEQRHEDARREARDPGGFEVGRELVRERRHPGRRTSHGPTLTFTSF